MANLLLDWGAQDDEANRSGDTPLHAAIAVGNEPLAKLLSQCGSNVNAANR